MYGKRHSFNDEGSESLKPPNHAPQNQHVATVSDRDNDKRIYLNITVNNMQYEALLDTGATVSVLGKGSQELWTNLKGDPIKETVRTANGQSMTCAKRLRLKVRHNNDMKPIKFLVIPEIAECVILGINFYHAFKMHLMFDVAEVAEICHTPKINHIPLTMEQSKQLQQAISKFLFSTESFVGCQTKIQHDIDTGDCKPICQRPYQYSPEIEEKMKSEIERWLNLGYIEPANTDWRHPIVPVIKKNGKIRLCLDARKLNAVTKRDSYISPDLNIIFRRFPKAEIFFSVDLTDAFMQTELKKDSREKTAFGIPGKGTFQFVRMPFGLKNASATQSRVMNSIIGEDLEPKVFHYLDDIVIATMTFDEMLNLIDKVATRLTRAGLSVNPDKLEGPSSRIGFVGRVFDSHGQNPEQSKIQTILNFPTPKTVKEVRSLVGTVTWYSHFIRDYSSIMAPITSLIKKKAQKVIWTKEAQQAFDHIKRMLTSYPVLRPPDYTRPFIIQCDASLIGIGAVLAQLDDTQKEYVVSYYSHKLTKEEQKYHAYERECLAVIKALDHFRPYVYLQPLIIITDHHSLTQTLNYRGKSGRLLRWSLMLQPHADQIMHRAGNQMFVADMLSRARTEHTEFDEDEFNHMKIYMMNAEITDAVPPMNDETLTNADEQTQQFELLRRAVTTHPQGNMQYKCDQNRLFVKRKRRNDLNDDWREIPHPNQRENAFDWAHVEVLHAGVDKTVAKLKEKFFWKGMWSDVKRYSRACLKCAQIKVPNFSMRGLMPQFNIPKNVGEEIQVDFKGPFPASSRFRYKFIIVAQEALSRFLIAKCIPSANVDSTIAFIEAEVLTLFPQLKRIKHDRGSQFMADRFQQFVNARNIKSVPTAAYAPHQNPVERANRSIGEALILFMLKNRDTHASWSKFVPQIIKRINNRQHDATKLRPYLVVFGREPSEETQIPANDENHKRLVRIAYENSKASYTARSKEHNKHASQREFNPGEWAMAKYRTLSSGQHNWMGKLAAKFYPVKITRKVGHNTYEVNDTLGQNHTLDVRSLRATNTELNEILETLENSQ